MALIEDKTLVRVILIEKTRINFIEFIFLHKLKKTAILYLNI